MKLRLGKLDNHEKTARLELESEATELSAIFSTIIRNMEVRLEREKREKLEERKSRKRKPDN